MPNRNYLADMTSAIDGFVPSTDYYASDLASEFVASLRITDPDLLSGWLDTCAEVLLTEYISQRRRSLARIASSPKAIAAARAFSLFESSLEEGRLNLPPGTLGGDVAAIQLFATHIVIDAAHLSRPLGKTTKEDHLWVSSRHSSRAKEAAVKSAFHAAIAKRIPKHQVLEQVMTPDKYLELRTSLFNL